MSRKFYWTLLLIGLMCCILAACTNSPVNLDAKVSSPKTLIVGGILSQTGGAAAYGGDAEKGAQLALDKINAEQPPIKIKYVSLDDKSDKTEAVKVFRTLIDTEGANVILGPAISPSALSVGKMAEERHIPIVATSATQDEITSSGTYNRTYVSRVCFNDAYQGKVLAKFAVSSLKKKSAAIIYDKTLSYSIGLAKNFRDEFTNLGGSIPYEENYSVNDTDYSSLIDKVKTYDVDLLFIPGWDENVGPMLNQAGSKWDKFTLLGGDGWPTKRLLELSGGHIQNAYAISHYAMEDPDPLVQDFQKRFQAKYHEAPSPFAALGYDAMMLIYDAAKRAKSFDGASLSEAINNSHDVKLVTGTLSFDASRNPAKDAVIVQIHPDKIGFLERIKL